MQKPAHHYLHFTKRERTGTLITLFIILLVILAPFIYSLIVRDKSLAVETFADDLAALKKISSDSARKPYYKKYDKDPRSNKSNYEHRQIKGDLFYFDPNTLSAAGWQKLGVKERTAMTI